MADSLDKTITDALQHYIKRVRENLERHKVNASHRTEQSLRIEKYDAGYRVVIGGGRTAPAETLQQGRPPGKVPYKFAEILLEWMKDKGIEPNDKFAHALAQRISQKGTLRWLTYGKNNAYLNIYTDEGKKTEDELQNNISAYFVKMLIKRQ